MSDAIRRVAVAFVAIFALISLGLVYWQVVAGPELAADRRFSAARRQTREGILARGRILDRNGEVLAFSGLEGDQAKRRYPYPPLAHAIGYEDPRHGSSGLEAAYDDYLGGRRAAGALDGLLDAVLGAGEVGTDLVTTLDLALQRDVDAALGAGRGAALVFDPRSGEVLALASHPTFDPNDLAESFPRLRGSTEAPLVNRVTQGLFPPGSTFKLVTLAAALETGAVTPATIFEDATNGVTIEGYFIADPNHPGVTRFDALHALAYSSNSAFARMGVLLGGERLAEWARRFGFGTSPRFDLDVTPSELTRRPDYLNGRLEQAVTAIGQGQIQATPFQLALVVGAVANDGIIPGLRIGRSLRAPVGGGSRLSTPPGTRVISAETASAIRRGMVLAVTEGGNQSMAIPGQSVAAKSGTAEVADGGRPHAWMAAFAPADDPRVAVVVIKENAGGGATVAGPIARRILERALLGR